MRHLLPILSILPALLLPPLLLSPAASATLPESGELLYLSEGNRLRRFDVDTIDDALPASDVLIQREGDGGEGGGGGSTPNGRDINGQICPFPDGSGRFVAGEDTNQPNPPAGWGIFAPDGTPIGKLTATYATETAGVSGQPETFGCGFTSDGRLFTTSLGEQGFGVPSGQLILWFPPYEGFPGLPGEYPNTNARSASFCKLATDIGTATGLAVDENDNVYVASASGFQVLRFSPPFPTGLGPGEGCEGVDPFNGSPMADAPNRSVLIQAGFFDDYATFTGLAMAPNGNLYAASIISGRIGEFRLDAAGNGVADTLVRDILAPDPLESFPFSTGAPQGLAVDGRGNVYYADLDLVGVFPNVGPGPDGKLRVIRFDESDDPLPPEILASGLSFPDGLGLLPGHLPSKEWRSYAGGPERRFHNPDERILTADNVGGLVERWRFPTNAIVTASPTVAYLDVPGEGPQQVAFIQSWDGFVYAVRMADGSELWRFETELQPGANFPNTASALVARVEGEERVFIGNGHVFYALDALTGAEVWRFTVGTGCVDENGEPPGLCGFDGEKNEIESSALLADGLLIFGMDVNDTTGGKGGLYAVHADDGRMAWFFDLESGQTCRPDPGDEIRQFDGYHSEAELNLPAGFLATRAGCDFPRSRNGCGNVWSTPSWDAERGLVFVTSSNCDTQEGAGDDPLKPLPPMPPYDEAVFALTRDGTPVWRWRAYAVDNDDFAFGASPNLFTIEVDGEPVDVIGVGQKDGHYRVFDRDGVNERNGIDCTVADPATGVVGCTAPGGAEGAPPAGDEPADFPGFPYWDTQIVQGGAVGGIPLTASADVAGRRVYIGTAPGFDPLDPEQPTLHALDMDTGAVVWDSLGVLGPGQDASFAPASSIPGVAFFGSTIQPRLRAHDTRGDAGTELYNALVSGQVFGAAVASGPVVVDGTLLVGTGIGFRSGNPQDFGTITSNIPSDLVALCVAGTDGCAACNDGRDNDLDGLADADDPGCAHPGDTTERADCVDARDNDHDGLADHPADPGCRNMLPGASESPACSDGRDNDDDGDVDFDADLECVAAWDDSESDVPKDYTCGLLGIEPWLLLGIALGLRRRGRAAAVALVAAAGWLAPTPAQAAPMPLAVRASLTVYVGSAPILGVAPRTGVVSLDPMANRLVLPAALVSTTGAGFTGAVSGTASFANASASFRFGGAASGTCPGPLGGGGACIFGGAGGGFGGAMPLDGLLRIPALATTLALSPVGTGYQSARGTALQGAPWTARTAAVTTTATGSWFTRMGSAPASWLATLTGGALPVQPLSLVTPVHVRIAGLGEPLPVFVELRLRAVPEPGTLVVLGSLALGVAFVRRRRPGAG